MHKGWIVFRRIDVVVLVEECMWEKWHVQVTKILVVFLVSYMIFFIERRKLGPVLENN
uniref:Uncharacterized protein n=1 Tax=Arundo donax TaxID=35708 RepID=A0A0A8YNE2_ARUDO